MKTTEQAQFLANRLICALVDKTDAVQIKIDGSESLFTISIKVDPWDTGKLIGKGGRTARSIRIIMSAFGEHHGANISVNIVEPISKLSCLPDGLDRLLPKHSATFPLIGPS